jgi:hypothetical protein
MPVEKGTLATKVRVAAGARTTSTKIRGWLREKEVRALIL